MVYGSMKNDSLRWLYVTIVLAALVAIVIVLIIFGSKPKDDFDKSGATYTNTYETNYRQGDSDDMEDNSASAGSGSSSESDSASTSDSESTSDSASASTPSLPSTPAATTPSYTPTPQPVEHSCYHEEAGVCWDDLENDAYSAGLYDREYGYHGASYDEPDNCSTICRDILEDAYEEGWADGGY